MRALSLSITAISVLLVAACGDSDTTTAGGADTTAGTDTLADIAVTDAGSDTGASDADTISTPELPGQTDAVAGDLQPNQDTGDTTDTGPPPQCVAGATRCDGYLLQKCPQDRSGFLFDQQCQAGCVDANDGAASCATSCQPGADVGCVSDTARRCRQDGLTGYPIACLGGCNEMLTGCLDLDATERPLATAQGSLDGVQVAAAATTSDGGLRFAWRQGGDATVRVVFADAEGNALGLPTPLPTPTTSTASTQLHLRTAPNGDLAVMAVAPSGTPGLTSVIVWRVPRVVDNMPAGSPVIVADGDTFELPALLAFDDRVAIVHLDTAGASPLVARADYVGATARADTTIATLSGTLDDLTAARVGATGAHVFVASTGTVQTAVISSTPAAQAFTTHTIAEALLFVGSDGDASRSLLAAFDFNDDPATAQLARFDGTTLAAFDEVGAPEWLQAALDGSDTPMVRELANGDLIFRANATDSAGDTTVFTPLAGAERSDFWVLPHPASKRVRVVTLGPAGPGESPRIWVSAP